MEEEIYNPLKEYDEVYRDKFMEVSDETFHELAVASGVDVEANRQLCKEIDELNAKLENARNIFVWMIVLCVMLWILVGVGIWALARPVVFGNAAYYLCGAAAVSLLLLLLVVHPGIRKLKNRKKALGEEVGKKTAQAWDQMSSLNSLYDWDIFSRMVTKTLPRMEFDPFFTTKRLADLVKTYGWDGSFNDERSILYSHSGLINGNPFVICRTRKMEWGEKTYTGYLTISWTTTERDSDGEYHTVTHTETLSATVTRPFPEYFDKSWLIYGNNAAPDLTFTRKKNPHKLRPGSMRFNRKRRKLERRARDLKQDYAMATNEEFEVLFTTTDRSDNQQYFLLFTPLAQESMVDLLLDEDIGYGDDFDFIKQKKINTIVADHMQEISLDMNPRQFHSYSFDNAKLLFASTNAENFRALYFCLAPLLCVPLYRQLRPLSEIYGREMPTESSFWEHEAIANFWGEEHFQHPDCETHSILKTREQRREDGHLDVAVEAYGYRSEEYLTYVSVWGGDGRLHDVPVEYREYYPVVGQGSLAMHEDMTPEDTDMTPTDRRDFILGRLGLIGSEGIYRRHIASRLSH
ncbi:MAG: hypothetical protein HUJ94_07965 [Bacteroidales bacterium]|nr:hypothetical protein [Bacteroidales bacterium]